MQTQTYLFYDIETTGLNKAFDQVLQFAAIRTDLQLQEIERYEWKVKLNPDVIPSPQAMLTHRISLATIEQGISEYDAIRKIHKIMNEPGTISIGYNTLGFDDEFLRFTFFRNLLPPYTHQYVNRCARVDLYPIAIMYHLFKRDVLTWPVVDSETKLKLELINIANNLVQGRAHDAMVDVEITIAVAKRFMAETEMWKYVTNNFNKEIDESRHVTLPIGLASLYGNHPEGLMILGRIGAAQYYQAPVILLGNHVTYKKQVWLRLDTDMITHATAENIADTTRVYLKKLGEPGFVLPHKERFLSYLTSERRTLAENNKTWLDQNPQIFKLIIEYHRSFLYRLEPATDVDASLYNSSFWTNEENAFCQRFHLAPPDEKVSMLATLHNPQLKKLASRLIGRNFPELQTDDIKAEFAEYLRKVHSDGALDNVVDFKGHLRLNPYAALAEIKTIREKTTLDPEQIELMNQLERFLLTKVQTSGIIGS